MTIETKFNIGDEVWFNALSTCKKGKVSAFEIFVFSDGSVQITYSVEKSGFYWHRQESALFPTKEELLKSL